MTHILKPEFQKFHLLHIPTGLNRIIELPLYYNVDSAFSTAFKMACGRFKCPYTDETGLSRYTCSICPWFYDEDRRINKSEYLFEEIE